MIHVLRTAEGKQCERRDAAQQSVGGCSGGMHVARKEYGKRMRRVQRSPAYRTSSMVQADATHLPDWLGMPHQQ
jgi:Ser/Thr protein kinase RdoA (MazF antagonist)